VECVSWILVSRFNVGGVLVLKNPPASPSKSSAAAYK
jgi:hypothetical protein